MIAVKELLDIEAEAKAYAAALAAVHNGYVPSARTTNFKHELEQHAGRLLPTLRFSACMDCEFAHHSYSKESKGW